MSDLPSKEPEVIEQTKLKLLKMFEARDPNGPMMRVAVWDDCTVSMCVIKDDKESVCHSSECKEGVAAEDCYEQVKKTFQRFNLTIDERTGEEVEKALREAKAIGNLNSPFS